MPVNKQPYDHDDYCEEEHENRDPVDSMHITDP